MSEPPLAAARWRRPTAELAEKSTYGTWERSQGPARHGIASLEFCILHLAFGYCHLPFAVRSAVRCGSGSGRPPSALANLALMGNGASSVNAKGGAQWGREWVPYAFTSHGRARKAWRLRQKERQLCPQRAALPLPLLAIASYCCFLLLLPIASRPALGPASASTHQVRTDY